jgi:hypothetical protein
VCRKVYPIGAAGSGLTVPAGGESVVPLGREPAEADEMADGLILEFDGFAVWSLERAEWLEPAGPRCQSYFRTGA